MVVVVLHDILVMIQAIHLSCLLGCVAHHILFLIVLGRHLRRRVNASRIRLLAWRGHAREVKVLLLNEVIINHCISVLVEIG